MSGYMPDFDAVRAKFWSVFTWLLVYGGGVATGFVVASC